MTFMTFHSVGNVIIPTDFHIFPRGRYTTNQTFIYIYILDYTGIYHWIICGIECDSLGVNG